jgi:iron only hydrogenase large subunit-like protein
MVESCEGIEWYSCINQKKIQEADVQFFEKNSIESHDFSVTLREFKKNIINREFELLYLQRTEEYRKTVPFNNFKRNIFGGTEMPVRIYFSNAESVIEKNKASVKSYYVMSNGKFETCTETVDNWIFDGKTSKWLFVKNGLSWGSPVIIE